MHRGVSIIRRLAALELGVAEALEALAEPLYPATIANLRYAVALSDGAVVVAVGGYAEPLPRLLDAVLAETQRRVASLLGSVGLRGGGPGANGGGHHSRASLHDDDDDAHVDGDDAATDEQTLRRAVREKYARSLRNAWVADVARHAKDLRLALLCPHAHATPRAKLRQLGGVGATTRDDSCVPGGRPVALCPTATASSARVLVHGNADAAYADTVRAAVARHVGTKGKHAVSLEEDLGQRPTAPGVVDTTTKVAWLRPGSTTRLVQCAEDAACPTTAVEVYWQLARPTEPGEALALRVLTELLEAALDEPLFDALRTKQQLGYTVACGSRYTRGAVGFGARVVTDTADPATVEAALDAFLREFRATRLGGAATSSSSSSSGSSARRKSSDALADEFVDHCRSVVASKLEKPRALRDLCEADWANLGDDLPFEAPVWEALAASLATPAALRAMFDHLFGIIAVGDGGTPRRDDDDDDTPDTWCPCSTSSRCALHCLRVCATSGTAAPA
mmetsp:Transcript_4608/g.18746  ORF Transcript_4608/g.18746 Transcript_4608/m.18746 type:complete len:508 (-) Transcript_4608:2096-3619(-)